MVNRPNAAQAASSGQADDDARPRRLAGEHVDDAAEQHRFGELRAGQQQIGGGEDPAQPRLFAEQLAGRARKGETWTCRRDSQRGVAGRTAVRSSILVRECPRDTGRGRCFAQLIRRPSSGGRKRSSKISAADGRLRNLKSSATCCDRAVEAGGIDAADAVAPDLAGQDVVGNQRAQPFQLQIARSAIHPADDFVHRAARAA